MLNVKKTLTKILKNSTLSATQTDYNTTSLESGVTIPSNGFLLMTKASASAACNYSVVVTRNSVAMPSVSQATPSGTIIHACLPVMKGDSVKLVSGYTGSPYAKLISYMGGVLLNSIFKGILTPCRKVVGVC